CGRRVCRQVDKPRLVTWIRRIQPARLKIQLGGANGLPDTRRFEEYVQRLDTANGAGHRSERLARFVPEIGGFLQVIRVHAQVRRTAVAASEVLEHPCATAALLLGLGK